MRHSRTRKFRSVLGPAPVLGAIFLVLGFPFAPGTSANNEPVETEEKRSGNDRSVGHLDHKPYETAADFFSAFLQTGDWAYAADRANNEALQRTAYFDRARDTHRFYLIKTRESTRTATPAQETHIRDNLLATADWGALDQLAWHPITFDQPPAAKNYAPATIARDDGAEDDLIAIFRSQRTF